MAHEITLVIRDPRGRGAHWWAGVLEQWVQERDAEIIEAEEEEV